MKYMVMLVVLGSLVFGADANTTKTKAVKKVFPRGTIATH